MTTRDRIAGIIAFCVAIQLPGIGRAPHYDEPNFLTLARGALADPWRPHDVTINWQGTTERAFDVLSNPPGIAWWLAPWLHGPIWCLRLAMLPWLALAAFGAWRLGERFLGDGKKGALVLLLSPIAIVMATALTPDAPLFALTLAGVGGYIHASDRDRPTGRWALLAGMAILFRYSGVCIAPLLGLYALLRARSPVSALLAWLPGAFLALHDVSAYGHIHMLAMGSFQSVSNTPTDVYHKCIASLAMLGGAVILPMYRWRWGALAGAAAGATAGAAWGGVGAAFGALGGAALGGAIVDGPAREDGWFLRAWALGGLAFLLTLRFTATRYWLPFFPGIALALPVNGPMVVAGAILGVALAADDAVSANAQERLADGLTFILADVQASERDVTGHWGWQYAMEKRGWKELDVGSHPADGALVAIATEAWPQPVAANCATVLWQAEAKPPYPWLPRGYSHSGGANLHANWIAPRTRTIAPWTFASDPYEKIKVCKE